MNRAFTAVPWTNALTEIGRVLRMDAKQAELMLEEACRRYPPRCGRCGCRRLYSLCGDRLRCADCRYSFRRFTSRWLGRHRLPGKVWLAAVKCFEVGLGARELAQVAGLSIPTASELERTVQMSVAALDPSWAPVVRACALGSRPPVRMFQVRQEGGGIRIEALPALPSPETERQEALGPIPVELPATGPALDSLRALRAGLRRWMRLPPDRLALKLKELEFRSNKACSFEFLLDALARHIPAGIITAAQSPRLCRRRARQGQPSGETQKTKGPVAPLAAAGAR